MKLNSWETTGERLYVLFAGGVIAMILTIFVGAATHEPYSLLIGSYVLTFFIGCIGYFFGADDAEREDN